MKRKVYSDETILEAVKWKEANGAKWEEAAKKFGIKSGDILWQAYDRRQKQGKFKVDPLTEVKKKRPYKKRKQSPQSFDMQVMQPKQSTVAFAIMPLSEAKEFLGNLW